MATQSIDITQITDTELKALAYDLQIVMSKTQQNYQTVVKELERRANPVIPTSTPTSQV